RIDPYGAHAGTEVTVEVSRESTSISLTLTQLRSSRVFVSLTPFDNDLRLIRVINGNGVVIAESPINDDPVRIYNVANGSDYIVEIEGNENYQPATSERFDLSGNVTIDLNPARRWWADSYIILTTSDSSDL